MRKSKRGAELFEVLQKGPVPDKQFEVPGWWRSRAPSADKSKSAETDSPEKPGIVAVDRGGDEHSAGSRHEAGVNGGAARTFGLDGSRLQISLTSFSAAIIIATGLMLLAVSYRIGQDRGFRAGRASYSSRVGDEIQQTRQGPPNRELLAGLQEAEAGADEPPPSRSSARFMIDGGAKEDAVPAEPVWVRGYMYINVQGFNASSGDDAERVQSFLAEHGVDTAIIPLVGGSRMLLTTRGYNQDDPAQRRRNEALMKRVRSLGLLYQERGGRYDWHDAYFRKLDRDSW